QIDTSPYFLEFFKLGRGPVLKLYNPRCELLLKYSSFFKYKAS
ncbi:hypothetical protein CDAR_201791, partial [Caerostris darwini]